MYQIVYTSVAAKPFKEDELMQLLNVARVNNAKKSITGMLLYCNCNFIQLLEGEEETVNELFNIISRDVRHQSINKVLESPIDKPQFPDWSMGYKYLTTEQLTNLQHHQHADVTNFIRSTQPYKLLKLLSAKSWN